VRDGLEIGRLKKSSQEAHISISANRNQNASKQESLEWWEYPSCAGEGCQGLRESHTVLSFVNVCDKKSSSTKPPETFHVVFRPA
jgi:hypothetical protein